ncbi:unnamed protein product [Ambrosiozyma monospora]|uniref:Unnamed protein product n=1 Tax=Ambrosiozyma monospora TaxID=43982 RepID=A0A9W6YX51_AMBMO|nr:unnamed protein product [Ambrosiozyma monospora]
MLVLVLLVLVVEVVLLVRDVSQECSTPSNVSSSSNSNNAQTRNGPTPSPLLSSSTSASTSASAAVAVATVGNHSSAPEYANHPRYPPSGNSSSTPVRSNAPLATSGSVTAGGNNNANGRPIAPLRRHRGRRVSNSTSSTRDK